MSIFGSVDAFARVIKLMLIPQDKANHFIYGAVIFTLGNAWLGTENGILLALFFAIGKEMYDALDHKPDWKDVLWTMIGAGVACLAAWTGLK